MPKQREFATRVVCPHGKAVILMGAEREDIERESSELIDAIIGGCTVQRVTVSEARKSDFGCDTCRDREATHG